MIYNSVRNRKARKRNPDFPIFPEYRTGILHPPDTRGKNKFIRKYIAK